MIITLVPQATAEALEPPNVLKFLGFPDHPPNNEKLGVETTPDVIILKHPSIKNSAWGQYFFPDRNHQMHKIVSADLPNSLFLSKHYAGDFL